MNTLIKKSIKDIISTLTILFLVSCVPTQQPSPISETELFKKAVPAIVVIYSFNENDEMQGQGTGFVINSAGTIATNRHVIDGSYALRVAFMNGEKYDVTEIVAIDDHRDIAIIKIIGFDLPTMHLGNSNALSIGEQVIAIGNPLGLSNTLSSGIISGIRTDLEDYKLIQTTTPISPGSSGGPLINMEGEVVGITTMYMKGGQNLNFAVPINYLIALNNQGAAPAQIYLPTEDIELKKELADKYYEEAKYFEAAELYFEITSVDSTDSIIFFKLGYSLHRIAVDLAPHNEDDPRWEEFALLAIENFSKSVELDPEFEYGFLKIARVYGLWMIDAIKDKKPAQIREALKNAQQSGGFFPYVLEANRSMLTSCSENSILFTNGDDDTFPVWYLQEIEKVRRDVTVINLSLLSCPFYIKHIRDFKGIIINLTDNEIDNLKPRNWPRSRDEIIELNNFDINSLHVNNLRLSIHHSYIAQDWDYLSISDQLVLEILKNYINNKDIYFSYGISWLDYSVPFSLYNHSVSEGLVYKIVTQPVRRIESYDKWEENLLNNYRYSIFSDPRIFGTDISYEFIHRYRASFNELAKIYHHRGNKKKVKEILDFKDDVIPKDNIPIPWEKLTEMYEDGGIRKLYDYAGLIFEEFEALDDMSQNLIETSWEPAAIDTPSYYYSIGEYYYNLKEFEKSKNYFEEYLKYEPNDNASKTSLMYIEFEKKNYSRALSLANELLDADPENVALNYLLGSHYSEMADFETAIEFYNNILLVDNQDYDVYNSYGLVLLYQKNYIDAIEYFNKVLEYAPSYAENYKYALDNIAETYKAMGEDKKAIEVFIELIEIDPTMSLAYSKLAILNLKKGDIKKSDQLLQVAKDNMWNNNYGQLGLACYYSYIGDLNKSIFYLESAIELGLTDFSWLNFDPDLENVRETDKFRLLIEK